MHPFAYFHIIEHCSTFKAFLLKYHNIFEKSNIFLKNCHLKNKNIFYFLIKTLKLLIIVNIKNEFIFLIENEKNHSPSVMIFNFLGAKINHTSSLIFKLILANIS